MLEAIQYCPKSDLNGVDPINGDDRDILMKIYFIMRRRNKLERFGVNLLLNQVNISDNEHLLETTDVKNRQLTTIPVEFDSVSNAIQTMWRFDKPTSNLCVGYCNRSCSVWGSTHHVNHFKTVHADYKSKVHRDDSQAYNALSDIDELPALDGSDVELLDEIRECLQQNFKQHRFGVNLLHRHFSLSTGEILTETCVPFERKLIAQVVKLAYSVEQVPTFWRFKLN